jgi:hypothetical protein
MTFQRFCKDEGIRIASARGELAMRAWTAAVQQFVQVGHFDPDLRKVQDQYKDDPDVFPLYRRVEERRP